MSVLSCNHNDVSPPDIVATPEVEISKVRTSGGLKSSSHEEAHLYTIQSQGWVPSLHDVDFLRLRAQVPHTSRWQTQWAANQLNVPPRPEPQRPASPCDPLGRSPTGLNPLRSMARGSSARAPTSAHPPSR